MFRLLNVAFNRPHVKMVKMAKKRQYLQLQYIFRSLIVEM